MGILGIGKGVIKIISGVIEGDLGKVAKGAGQTALGAATTIISTIKGDADVEIINPDHVIATLSKGGKLNMELILQAQTILGCASKHYEHYLLFLDTFYMLLL